MVYPSWVDETRPGDEEYFSYKVDWSDPAVWTELLNAGWQCPGKFDVIPLFALGVSEKIYKACLHQKLSFMCI